VAQATGGVGEYGRDESRNTDLAEASKNHKATEVAQRLADAVRLAGGPLEVSRRSGIPRRSLNHYLAGRGMKMTTMAPLAEVCGVNLEWLATGRGPMRGGAEVPVAAQPTPPPKSPPPSGDVLPPLSDTQETMLKTAFILGWNMLDATGQRTIPLEIWSKTLEYYNAMVAVEGNQSIRLNHINKLMKEEMFRYKGKK